MAEVVLGIETSCDETSAAVLVTDGRSHELASLIVTSQDIHKIFGGVVPELASRAHLRLIDPAVDSALREAGVPLSAVDAVAVTAGPGLAGALIVGVCYAKALALGLRQPLVGVHHLEGHLFAPTLEDPDLSPPFVALLVSGGHTMLLDVRQWGSYRMLGGTRDDAAGEAFDKVATLLGLDYPGGPEIERLAAKGEDRFSLPRPMLQDGYEFSFSGLKTAVLHAVRRSEDLDRDRNDLAASFQGAVLDVLASKALAAAQLTGYDTVVLSGGVACNRALKARLAGDLGAVGKRLAVASPRLNMDNAAMIARAGWFHLSRGRPNEAYVDVDPSLPLPGLEPGSIPV